MKSPLIEELKTQIDNLQAFLDSAHDTAQSLAAELGECEKELEAAERAALRTGHRGGLDEIEARARTLRERLENHIRRTKIAQREVGKVGDEITEARKAEEKRWENMAYKLAEGVEDKLRKDAKLRATLVDLFSHYATCRGIVNWEGILLRLFPEPEGGEFEKAHKEARAKIEKALS